MCSFHLKVKGVKLPSMHHKVFLSGVAQIGRHWLNWNADPSFIRHVRSWWHHGNKVQWVFSQRYQCWGHIPPGKTYKLIVFKEADYHKPPTGMMWCSRNEKLLGPNSPDLNLTCKRMSKTLTLASTSLGGPVSWHHSTRQSQTGSLWIPQGQFCR